MDIGRNMFFEEDNDKKNWVGTISSKYSNIVFIV